MSSLAWDYAKTIGRESDGREQEQQVDAQAVLAELFELLNDYGPGWYTEGLHNRVLSALRKSEPQSIEKGAC